MTDKRTLVDYPLLVAEWDYEKNVSKPEDCVFGHRNSVWWVCNRGHSYVSKISLRIKGSGCPYCSNQKVLKGFNDFESQRSQLMKFWNYSKNSVDPSEITSNSGRVIWWLCNLGHEFKNSPNMMSRGRACPYCSNKKVLQGFNDVATLKPELIVLWSDKNISSLSDYVCGSGKEVWWKCSENHEFKNSIRTMVKNPKRCAVCSNKKVLQGFNDVATVKPELLVYWDYQKNIYEPSEVTVGRSSDKTFWICDNDHSFSSTLADVKQGKWCPQCSNLSYISKPEKEIADFLKSELKVDVLTSNRVLIPPYEIDMFLPDSNIGIEFNGLFWHSEEYMRRTGRKNAKFYHYHKWNLCRKKNIDLIQIWEDDWAFKKKDMKNMLKNRLSKVFDPSDVGLHFFSDKVVVNNDLGLNSVVIESMGYEFFSIVEPSEYCEVNGARVLRDEKVFHDGRITWDSGKTVYVKRFVEGE